MLTIAQPNIELGGWASELPYSNVVDIVVHSDEVAVATENGLFYFDRMLRSVEPRSTIDGLSGVSITAMSEHRDSETLIIAYDNQIIDLIRAEQKTSFFDIQRFNIIGERKINHILSIGDRIFFSCGYGIAEFDFLAKEFNGPYFIGENGSKVVIYEMTTDGQYLYAAAEDGLYSADINDPNLRDFNAWTKDPFLKGPINTLTYFDGALYVNKKDLDTKTDTVYFNKSGNWEPLHELLYWRRNSLTSDNDFLMVCTKFSFSAYNSELQLSGNMTQSSLDYPFEVTTAVQGDAQFNEFFLGTTESGLVRYWGGFKCAQVCA